MRRSTLAILVALAAAGAGCASSGAVPRPFPMPANARAANPPAHGAASPEPAVVAPDGLDDDAVALADASSTPETPALFRALVETALALRGAPYKNGGGDPNGFDCSGFTQYVFAQHGLALPRQVRDQFSVGTPISPSSDLAPGDLLFFTTTAPGASHVAISLGGDEFVHAPSSKGVVRVEKLTTGYWSERFLGARRLTQP